jgi:uncharacterized protein YfdQ (DUF2303 family)
MISQELIDALASLGGVHFPGNDDGVPFVTIPAGYKVEDLEKLLPAPVTAKGAVAVHDTASFVSYLNVFKDDGTRIFADAERPVFVGVIDYHKGTEARHGRHRATFAPRKSEQWTRWVGISGKAMSQADLARFLEENSLDVRTPDAATLMEMAHSFEATKSGAFRSGTKLQSGAFQLNYSEEINASAGGGTLQIPDRITLGIPVFENGLHYEVTAWLRYRIDEGRLKLTLELHRTRFIVEDAFKAMAEEVQKETGIPVLRGTLG